LRAWRGLEGFDGRASTRYWLYRIGDERLLERPRRARERRPLLPKPKAGDRTDADANPAFDIAWLEPYPDSALEQIADEAPGPDAQIRDREGRPTGLRRRNPALPPRSASDPVAHRRAGWSAARAPGCSIRRFAAVNSAPAARPHDARRTAGGRPSRVAVAPSRSNVPSSNATFVPWESTDVDGFTALLKKTR